MKEMNCAMGINFCWLPLVAMRTVVDACHVKTCQVNVAYWCGWCCFMVVNNLFVVAVAVAFDAVVAV